MIVVEHPTQMLAIGALLVIMIIAVLIICLSLDGR
jgi:hypothetical protein